jgi:hypothetical protein
MPFCGCHSRSERKRTEKNRQLEEKVKAFEGREEEVKDIATKAYLLGRAKASFEAATATEVWAGLPPYKSNLTPLAEVLVRVGEEALDGKGPEPLSGVGAVHEGYFARLGSRPEWWKIQNPPTEFKKTPPTKQEGTPSDPEPDPDF